MQCRTRACCTLGVDQCDAQTPPSCRQSPYLTDCGVGLAGTGRAFPKLSLIADRNGRLDGATGAIKSTWSVTSLRLQLKWEIHGVIAISLPRMPATAGSQLRVGNLGEKATHIGGF